MGRPRLHPAFETVTCPNCGKERTRTFRNRTSEHKFLCPPCGILLRASRKTHGEIKTKLYYAWSAMKQRCLNSKNKFYAEYGGRGITVCAEWMDDFIAFAKWSRENGFADDLQIDRIDNNSGYRPDNCRWTTPTKNLRNRRTVKTTEEEVAEIKFLRSRKVRREVVAKAYGLRPEHVTFITMGLLWKDVPPADYLCIPV